MRSLRWTLIQYNWHPFKKRKFGSRDRHAQRADGVETERGQPSVGPGEGPGTRPSLTALRGSNLLMPGPWTSRLQNCETTHFCCLSHQSVGLCYRSPNKLLHSSRKTCEQRNEDMGHEHPWRSGLPMSSGCDRQEARAPHIHSLPCVQCPHPGCFRHSLWTC